MPMQSRLAVWALALAVAGAPVSLAAQGPTIVTGLKQPESIAIGPQGRIYVSETGEYEVANDGYISLVEAGKLRRFATGLDDPHGIKWWRDHLFVADNMGMVWRIDAKGGVERWVDATDFPRKITNFNDLEIDSAGNIYISDSGDWEGGGGAIFRITQERKIAVVLTGEDDPRLVSPNGLLLEEPDKLLVVDYTTGILFRIDLKAMLPTAAGVPVQPASKTMEKVAGGLGAADGLVRDPGGRLIVTDYAAHRVFVLAGPDRKPGEKPRQIEVTGIESAADLAVSPDGKSLLIPDMGGGKLATLPMPR